jgi:hypothetical protein
MKSIPLQYSFIALMALAPLFACNDDDKKPETDPNTGVVFSTQGDQVGRPGLNIVFIGEQDKDLFNATKPSQMAGLFKTTIKNKLLSLNPNYTTNVLGLNVDQFSGALATDVLNVSLTGKTTYYDGTTALTGRTLDDDVIDGNFTLIFGGPTGSENPQLTSDHVDHNDKEFLPAFPYEANPW